MQISLRLAPTVRKSDPEELVQMSEVGIFHMITYFQPLESKNQKTGEPENGVQVWCDLGWVDQTVQRHIVLALDEAGEIYDLFDPPEAEMISAELHKMYNAYLNGEDNGFPALRALGWTYVPSSQLLQVQMEEQHHISRTISPSNPDFALFAIWMQHMQTKLGINPPEIDHFDLKDLDNLSENIQDFLNDLLGGEDESGVEPNL